MVFTKFLKLIAWPVALVFGGCAYSMLAVSQPYYWGDNDLVHFSSPASVCEYLVNKNTNYPGSYTLVVAGSVTSLPIYYPVAYPALSKAVVGCRFSFRHRSEVEAGYDRIYTIDNYAALRYGDGCPPPTSYNFVSGMCGQDKERGKPSDLSCVGNPISVLSGNKFQREVDFHSNEFEFGRYYNSLDGIWRGNFSDRIASIDGGDKITLTRSDGATTFYDISAEKVTPEVGDLGLLQRNSDGWMYSSPTGEILYFDAQGRLTLYINELKKRYNISYEGSVARVTAIVNKLVISSDALGQPVHVQSGGIVADYAYEKDRLVSVTVRSGEDTRTRSFIYDEANPRLLTGIVDERGVRFATWDYDSQGRAVSSRHSGGAGLTQVTYNDAGLSTVTNELGKKTIYHYKQIAGANRVVSIEGEPSTDCPASNSTYSYNDRGQIINKTDARGTITAYEYNERGLETRHTEADGTQQARMTITEWDPIRFLRTKVVEPTRTTSFTYDAQGRETGRQVMAR
jgi:YD repeat-containing protein